MNQKTEQAKPAILISKITLKGICGGSIKIPSEPTALARVVGFANGSEEVVTTFGISDKLKGLFRAVNLETGEQFESAVLFLPTLAANQVVTALGAGAAQVEMAFDVMVVPTGKTTGSGYQFLIRPLFAPTAASPLDKLMESVNAGMAAPGLPLIPKHDERVHESDKEVQVSKNKKK